MDAMDILIHNYNGEDGTFIGELHEHERFNYKYYREYYLAIKQLAEDSSTQLQLDRSVTDMIFDTYRYFFGSAFWNSSSINSFKISGISEDELHDYTSELSFVVKDYIRGAF